MRHFFGEFPKLTVISQTWLTSSRIDSQRIDIMEDMV